MMTFEGCVVGAHGALAHRARALIGESMDLEIAQARHRDGIRAGIEQRHAQGRLRTPAGARTTLARALRAKALHDDAVHRWRVPATTKLRNRTLVPGRAAGLGYAPPVSMLRHVFRWDLDKTYLRTEFDTVRDLVRTARLSAEERENIPGSAALLRAIKSTAASPAAHPVYFISGSPNLIRAVIEKKFSLDGFQPDGFVLKPTVSDVMRGRFRAVRAQVAYKLVHLLKGRAEVPVGVPETLFGDDAEADAFIYSLYADFVAGGVSKAQLLAVAEEAGGYPYQLDDIQEALESIVHEPAIQRIVIHLDRATPPEAFAPLGRRVVPIANHLQTALVLALDGTLPAEVVRRVADELIERYAFDEARLLELGAALLAGFGAHHPGRARLATGLGEELEKAGERAAPVVRGLAELAAAATATPETPAMDDAPRDYAELWRHQKARAEEPRPPAAAEGRAPAAHTDDVEAPLSSYARSVIEAEPPDDCD